MPKKNMLPKTEREAWLKVKKQFDNRELSLGRDWSYNIYNDPKRLGFVLSRYKFASRMACAAKRVLELGCNEGIGIPILSEFSKTYLGVDVDNEAIQVARKNWGSNKVSLITDDFLGKKYGEFDSIVCFDVIEHIKPVCETEFLKTIYLNLGNDGICIIGTPNITAAIYASIASRKGHVNLFDSVRLASLLTKLFHNVFLFGINDEVVHTGFLPMAHYLLAIGCYKRKGKIF